MDNESTSGDRVDFPTFKIEDKELPIMLCGSAPFVGIGQFGFRAFEYRVRFYNHPDNMADIFVHFVKQGCKGAHVLCFDNILKAVKMAYDVEPFPIAASLNVKDIALQLKKLSMLKTVLVFVHPSQTDSLNRELLRGITKEIRDAGMIPGLATNAPGTSIPVLDTIDIDFSAYLTSINKEGKYMVPSRKVALETIKSTEKKVVAENPLPGKIPPEEGLPFVMEHCDSFSMGFTEKDQIDDTYKILEHVMNVV
ncbi:MAG: hypothetical protein HXS48_09015 [Theionarchaea archaeon]|nr:hypothetical protein [Theionarchaea archaeon]